MQYHAVENVEVGARRRSLEAAHLVRVARVFYLRRERLDGRDRGAEFLARRALWRMVAHEAAKGGLRVRELAEQDAADYRGGLRVVVRDSILPAAQQDVAVDWPLHAAEEFSVFAEEGEVDAMFRAVAHEREGRVHLPEAQYRFKNAYVNRFLLHAVDFHDDVVVPEREPRPRRSYEKRVERLFHRSSSPSSDFSASVLYSPAT